MNGAPAPDVAAMDPVAWIFAQAGAPGAAPTPGSPDAAPPASPSWSARIFPFLETGEPVGFAPPRWGGNLTLEYLNQRPGDANPRHVSTGTLSLAAASYFWQPWFAQVQGTMTVLAALEKGDGFTALDDPAGTTRTLSLSGGGTLTVFPGSRFPFFASVDSTDSRATGEFAPSDYRNTRASLRQTYRDALGTTSYSGSVDYSLLDSAAFGRDSVVALDARYLGIAEPHRLDAALAFSRNRRTLGLEGSDIVRAFGTHVYTPTPDLWVNSLASFTETDFDLRGADRSLTQRVGQLTSQAVWRPEFDERLVVTGGARLFSNALARSGEDATSHSVSGNAGASFALSEEATLNAAVNATRLATAGGGSSVVTFESLGGNYVSRPIDLKVASYSWSASLQGANQSGGVDGNRVVASLQADQQLSRNVELGRGASLSLLLTQGGGVIEDTFLGRTDTLRLGASAGLRAVTSESSDAYFGASYGQSDSRGGLDERFRLANIQANGQVRFGQYDTLSANLTAQWIRSDRAATAGEDASRQVFGGVSYQHTRVFGVPRLRYVLSASFNEGLQNSRLLGEVDAPRENVSNLFEQRLVYDIGRLELRVGMRIAKIDNHDDLQWYLRIGRQFGQY